MKNEDPDHRNRLIQPHHTTDHLKAIEKRRIERLEYEQAVSDLNLLRAFALGHALSGRKG